MDATIRAHIDECKTCLADAIPAPHKFGESLPPSLGRLDYVFVDYLFMRRDAKGNYVLVFRDAYSSYTDIHGPFDEADGSNLARSIVLFAARAGAPRFLRVDRAQHNINQHVHDTVTKLGISLDPNSSPYTPWALGVGENANKDFLRHLRLQLLDHLSSGMAYDTAIPWVIHTINSSPRLSLETLSPLDVFKNMLHPNQVERALAVRPSLPDIPSIFTRAAEKRNHVRVTSRDHKNKHRSDASDVHVGDLVFVQRVRSSNKLSARNIGPSTVEQVLSDAHTFVVRLLYPPTVTMTVSAARIIPYKRAPYTPTASDKDMAIHTFKDDTDENTIYGIRLAPYTTLCPFDIRVGDPNSPSDDDWFSVHDLARVWGPTFTRRFNSALIPSHSQFLIQPFLATCPLIHSTLDPL
jgi:hypothetical protein